MSRATGPGDFRSNRMRDPYEILGVSKTASPADIKKAYRKLAKKLHPDANTKDPKAANRFAELNSAYEIVGDDDKRKAFDRGEIDAEGKPRFQGFEGRPGGGPFGGRESNFEILLLGAGRLSPHARRQRGRGRRRRLRGHSVQHVRRARAARRARSFEAEDIGSAIRGQDVTATAVITLERSRARRHTAPRTADRQGSRVQDPARHRRRQADQAERPGHAGAAWRAARRRPDHDFDRAAPAVQGGRTEPAARTSRSRSTKPCSAPRCGCRRSTARSSLRSRPNTSSGRTFRLKGKGLPGKTAGRPLRHDQDRAARRQGRRARRADETMARKEPARSARRDGIGAPP